MRAFYKKYIYLLLIFSMLVALFACNAGNSINQSNPKAITEYSLLSSNGRVNGIINKDNISVIMTPGTDVTRLIATFTITGSSLKVDNILQTSGETPNNFTHPVVYTVTAIDGTTFNYTVTVIVPKADHKSITTYSLNGIAGKIYEDNIFVEMPHGTNLESLVATFTATSTNVKVGNTPQTSGETPNDFTHPVIYTVTAVDGETRNYKVIVTITPLFICIKDNVSSNPCGCLQQNDGSNLIWYVGEKLEGTWTNWCSQTGKAKDSRCNGSNGNLLLSFNSLKHCGYNDWHLPTMQYPSEILTVDRVGGEWGALGEYAKTNGWNYHQISFDFFIWLNNHNFVGVQMYPYWSSVSDNDNIYTNAWNVFPSGYINVARNYEILGVLPVRSSK